MTENSSRNIHYTESVNNSKIKVYAVWEKEVYSSHIKNAIGKIENFVTEIKKFKDFDKNKMLVSAVERNFEITGDAACRIKRCEPTILIANMKSIISLRNRVIPAYNSIYNLVLWSTVIKHMPDLKNEAELLLIEKLKLLKK